MVKRDIVEDGDAGLEQRNRAVAFVHFADEELAIADPGAGKRRLRIQEVFHIRAIHDGWILAGAVQNPAEHPDRGGLAARAGDADARAGGVEELGKKLRAGGDGGGDMTRGLHARKKSTRSVLRPWSSARSEPSPTPPLARIIKASGVMPLPPMPQKKYSPGADMGG